jgi:DNA processing protein
METRENEAAALLTLLENRRRGQTWGSIAAEVAAEGSAAAVLHEEDNALIPDPALALRLNANEEKLRSWRAAGYKFVTVLDPEYPRRLRDIHEMPPFLFYEGDLRPDDDGMSVVGSRTASESGRALARATAGLLVQEGLTVIGGLAEGIDAVAHATALDAGGRTVAFIGTGISRHYPVQNTELQNLIARKGLVLSQFYPDAPPTKHTFPMRNASMSGYGLATIVIEASEYSGSRIQARVAGEHGRPVILTSRVVESTQWGRALVGNSNVTVVKNLTEMRDAIRSIREFPSRFDETLSALQAA